MVAGKVVEDIPELAGIRKGPGGLDEKDHTGALRLLYPGGQGGDGAVHIRLGGGHCHIGHQQIPGGPDSPGDLIGGGRSGKVPGGTDAG